ncbi:MAG: aminoacyl-tRNA hydrolase [Candidatus Magasanikbacteria bacterium]|jgi:peptidyl-tRNA hydrolase, PTH1 family|nr:aminoacyl-tRNA hydrolase [Candidatus Magasanikbacteria bacterium]MBT4221522.1 aminoacyl-tRNA hydrolase [Candidatus Magasanikbacteria bacterium]MBT4350473.1 aminoacyl-tRNA hydrolase [Candidatus Magasanikbacteria bacterium]MBT4541860.1 aminoacyl-tRNA hydrolase [Candidatus Magasanikbacteria bacterium]MBT6253115.1 aminoacyl-tRNA hydrolase [Candidatus Magasanikbacteria bacterium]
MKLIVGLGNPGTKYVRTRHNIGFMALDRLCEEWSKTNTLSSWSLSRKFNAETCGGTINGVKVLLLKPTTYMNASGQAVQLAAHFYKIPPRDIIVVHDDKDILLGTLKVQFERGHGGHNGIRSIIDHLHSKSFHRIRLGIASTNPRKMQNTASFVLRPFGLLERKHVRLLIEKAEEEITRLIQS